MGHSARQMGSRYRARSVAAGWSAAVALLVVLAGCGDATTVAVGGGPLPDGAVILPDGGTTNPNARMREIVVLHDTSRPLPIGVADVLDLRVKVIDYTTSGPARGAVVRYSLTDGEGGEASLSALSTIADDGGGALVALRAGLVADVTYRVEVSTEHAEPVSFEVVILDAPRGDLRVALQYEGPVSVKNVNLQLVGGSFTCGHFNPVRPPDDVISEKTLLGINDSEVVFEGLPTSQRFTVIATAENQRGSLAAAGCLDGIVVLDGDENKVTLTMYLLVLNPTGIYESQSVFDFTGAIPGQLGELVTEISTLFSSPGTFLIDQVRKLAALYVGEFIADAAFGLFEDKLAEIIDDWMFNNSPQWVQDILQVGQDLFQVVNNLEMLSDLHISKLQSDYYVQGRLVWNGIVLYWHWGCAREDEPGYDPECARNEFSLAQFQNTQFPMDIIEGRFTGQIADFDQLDIDNHTIKINYGKLIIFVLNELILPALSGEHNLRDAVLSFVNCDAIARGIGSFDSIDLYEEDIEDFCIDAVSLIVSPIQFVLGALAIDSQLRMSGSATLVDDDNDLIVDEIIDGAFLGHFESDGQAGSPFTGVWQAGKRALPTANP